VSRREYRFPPGAGIAPLTKRNDVVLDSISIAGAKLNMYNDAPPGTTFQNGGGPIIGNVDIQLVFWGREWASQSPPVSPVEIQNRIQTILHSPYLSKLTQYGCSGNGRVRGTTFVTDGDPVSTPHGGRQAPIGRELTITGGQSVESFRPAFRLLRLPEHPTTLTCSSAAATAASTPRGGVNRQISSIWEQRREDAAVRSATRLGEHFAALAGGSDEAIRRFAARWGWDTPEHKQSAPLAGKHSRIGEDWRVLARADRAKRLAVSSFASGLPQNSAANLLRPAGRAWRREFPQRQNNQEDDETPRRKSPND